MSDEKDDSDFERRTKRAVRRQRGGARCGDALAAHAGALSSARGAQGRARRRLALVARAGGDVGRDGARRVARPSGRRRPRHDAVQSAALGDLEILLGEEDLEMLDEELEFYGWLEEQPEFAGADDSVG